LHKHCNLDKWKIWEYTLPQVIELLRQASKYIEFEVSTRVNPFMLFGGGSSNTQSDSSNSNSSSDDEFKEITEDDLQLLAQALGGG